MIWWWVGGGAGGVQVDQAMIKMKDFFSGINYKARGVGQGEDRGKESMREGGWEPRPEGQGRKLETVSGLLIARMKYEMEAGG